MKICFLNRIRGNQPGGDMIQLDATVAALRSLSHDAFFLEDFRDPIPDADIYHAFHVNFGWSRQILTGIDDFHVKQSSRSDHFYDRLVITPIFFPDDNFGVPFAEMASLLSMARMVTPFSQPEINEITTLTGFTGPFTIIPNGTSHAFHALPDNNRRGPVMGACHVYPGKNVHAIQDACDKDLKGQGLTCEIISGIPHDQMPAILKKARVWVNSSTMEIMSLTTAEALCAWCRVIDTTENRGGVNYPGLVRVDPRDRAALALAILTAWESPVWDWTPNERSRQMDWDWVARNLAEVYRCVSVA